MGSIFQVMIQDRHTDTEAIPFSTAEKALEFAKDVYATYVDATTENEPDMGVQETPDGWLYLANYSVEGDCIWVVEQELDRESES